MRTLPRSASLLLLLTGCSAGGLATYLHTDYLHAELIRIAPELRRYKSAPISGFFLDHETVEAKPVYPVEMKYIFGLANATGGVNAACIAGTPIEDHWRCNFAQEAYAFTSSAIFPLNSALDSARTKAAMQRQLPTATCPRRLATCRARCEARQLRCRRRALRSE